MKLLPAKRSPEHGGNLSQAVSRFGGPEEQWLDLSSAVSPWSWAAETDTELNAMPVSRLQHLPQPDAELDAAVKAYYGRAGLVCTGSQAAIQALPYCFSGGEVWLLAGTYGEHKAAWQAAGHNVLEKSAEQLRNYFSESADSCDDQASAIAPDIVVVTNPGNPGGELFSHKELLSWSHLLQKNHGWLVVDEAFMDATPQLSLLNGALSDNIILLRSVGKFFGMAGLRAGVVFASAGLSATLNAQLGPWSVSGMTQWLLEKMLSDQRWQLVQRQRLQRASDGFHLLRDAFSVRALTPLFVTLATEQAEALHTFLAERKIWSRCFKQQKLLRLGLPADDDQWQRLYSALQAWQVSD